ncbi:MAG TPA: Omp28-related outer membrane protein [candidate division WOR-3 bacterium]|uniref:Omp28-related outer membrane protein n=1 Tax=candidate division WOR-3 bacterium TaxID=2052148 RepID=A0A9C9EMM6_UNCW3|nr:Omp28-related outer membrane protein [candidate division WOR-3 bacterium]
MHISSSYPLYCAEAVQRMYTYPPPYYYNGSWYYATPWLWYDGDPHGSYTYSTWESKITSRMSQPSPVTVTMWGDYDPGTGTGTINAQFRNDSTATLNGRVLFVITEDSLYYAAPNGDYWHNHVARDYIPNQNGQSVSIAPGDSVTVTQSFTIQSGWDDSMCEIVTFIQNPTLASDSTKEVWQGGIVKVLDLIGIKEESSKTTTVQKISPVPNPCVNGTNFQFELPIGSHYEISIFDITGRLITKMTGTATGNRESIKWSLKDDTGSQVGAGVYFYRFDSQTLTTNGKIVVR